MNSSRQRGNWLLDAVLLVGFFLAMLLDMTGLEVHQWLGLAVPALAIYHLARHWQWFAAVGNRFFGKTSGAARRNYAIDAALLTGLVGIAVTGVAMSTWFDLPLPNYSAWLTVHIAVSLAALALLVVKVGLHWRWIVMTARRYVLPAPRPQPAAQQLQPVPVTAHVRRRDFLGLMAAVSVTSLLAGTKAADGIVHATAAPSDSAEPVGGEVASASAPAASSAACSLVCDAACSYPGRCRRYVDANANNFCDLGECVSGESLAQEGSNSEGSAARGYANETGDQACSVACDRRCAYPGHCRRYVDANANNLCDLGECGSGGTAGGGYGRSRPSFQGRGGRG